MHLPQSTPQTLQWTGEKIRDLRQRLGWSQAELARRLGCRQQTVSEWETDIYQPQNAYSQLLDRAFEDSQNFVIKTPPKPSKAPAKTVEYIKEDTESSSETLFDSFID